MTSDEFSADAPVDTAAADAPRRDRSTIDFPYMDLATAIAVAQGVYSRNGGGDVQADELAVELNLSPTSSGFRTRLATAKTFGLIQSARGADAIGMTDLGLKIVDANLQRRAKADAFLKVELFRTIYEKFKGMQLPPAAALERRLLEFGVAPKQIERARQIFERSAETAGYFDSGRDRLVRPAKLDLSDTGAHAQGTPPDPGDDSTAQEQDRGGRGGGGGGRPPVDPIIEGLLARLPPTGAVWPEKERALWLELLSGSFKLIYRDKDAEA